MDMPRTPHATISARAWLGYFLTLAAPAIGWILEDKDYMMRMSARMVSLIVLLIGVILTAGAKAGSKE